MYSIKSAFFLVFPCLILVSWQAKADIPQETVSCVEYQHYDEQEGKEYQRFLPPLHEGQWYYTRMVGIGNVDNTPDVEEIALITLQNSVQNSEEHREPSQYWQAFLLVCIRHEKGLEKKYLLEIFNNTEKEFSTEKPHPPMIFERYRDWEFFPSNGSFQLIDLNYDGILDIFIQLSDTGGSYFPYCVEVVSFQSGELKRLFTSFAGVTSPQVLDIDSDGLYEIQIPDRIAVVGFEHATDPTWVSSYEWNGKEYILNNEKFYSKDNDILIQFLQFYCQRLRWYTDQILYWGSKTEMYFEDYEFYLGLIYYYKEKPYLAKDYLERIIEKAKNKGYIKEAQSVLKQLQDTNNSDIHGNR
jgi:hypothetical protein